MLAYDDEEEAVTTEEGDDEASDDAGDGQGAQDESEVSASVGDDDDASSATAEIGERCPDEGCPEGFVCIESFEISTCEIACEDDDECPLGYHCSLPPVLPEALAYVCVANEEPEPSPLSYGQVCQLDDECEEGLSCLAFAEHDGDTCSEPFRACSQACSTTDDCEDLSSSAVCFQGCALNERFCGDAG